MAPKAVKPRSSPAEPSYARSVVQGLASSENRSVVTAIGMFAVGVAFLHSSWSEILLPA
ncbi:uncharacterized protein BDR25DRAFT_302198 [Lindgomyces ingoldianus]|uniref:Uncharacterized protein n=1 Tax=Lindgomyces ingoldianus TaxID=673940 RepID=A0ACB6R219_9PLEO|nr:uncharacterized protein BDR25DRAFT_302198 [Lindgomyces ingoldianus]KAF2473236.1 hypothetical protein BDR25DRAFT_302198 [Lindgomyces ingoldianus]